MTSVNRSSLKWSSIPVPPSQPTRPSTTMNLRWSKWRTFSRRQPILAPGPSGPRTSGNMPRFWTTWTPPSTSSRNSAFEPARTSLPTASTETRTGIPSATFASRMSRSSDPTSPGLMP